MILKQRKRHRIIWLLWAVLLPLLFVLSVLWLPKEVHQDGLFQKEEKIDVQAIKAQ